MMGGRSPLPPLQNRVLPTQEIVSDPARGLFTGNRGILPFQDRKLGVSRWKHHHWIICDLQHPKGRYHGPMPARAWTPLFFLDEAVGLAAGHRPCAYCRPKAYAAFKAAWAEVFEASTHKGMDRDLHHSRVTRSRQQIRHQAPLDTLPEGAFVLHQDQPSLFRGGKLYPYNPNGYSAPFTPKTSIVAILTPRPTLGVLRAGFQPVIHPSACQQPPSVSLPTP